MSSPVITVNSHDKANEIAALMSSKMIGSVIVVDDDSNPIGVITERDIVRRVFPRNIRPNEVKAEDFMSTPIKTIDPDSTITDAAKAMKKFGIRRLIIIEESKLVGIISSDDIIKIMPELITVISIKPTESYPEAFDKLWKESATKSREKEIPRSVVLNAIRLSYDCALKEEEGRPTSTGFIIGNPKKILKILPKAGHIIFPKQDIRESADYLRTLFGVVDGISSAFVIDKKGNLAEVGLFWPLPKVKFKTSALIAPRYRPYAYVTETLGDSLAFFSFGKLKVVKLFEDGSLIAESLFSWKKAKWVFRSFRKVVDKLGELAAEKGINFDVLCKCFSLAVEMSNRRLGGSFLIGDHETVLTQSEKPLFRFKNANLLDFDGEKEEYVINLASKDFATILDASGSIVASSTRLLAKSPAGISEVTPEDGGRHRSTAEMSAAASKCIAIVISEDGPITIYSKGKRIMRI